MTYEDGTPYEYELSNDEKLVLVYVDYDAIQVFDLKGVARSEIMRHPDIVQMLPSTQMRPRSSRTAQTGTCEYGTLQSLHPAQNLL